MNDQFKKSELTELEWQAMRYLTSELSEDELAQFESQLKSDLAAREATDKMLSMIKSIVAVEAELETQPVVAKSQPAWSVTRYGVALAASLALVACGVWYVKWYSNAQGQLTNSVATVWVESLQSANTTEFVNDFEETESWGFDDVLAIDDEAGTSQDGDSEVDWLLVAIAGMESSNE